MFSEKGDRTDQLAAVALLDASIRGKLSYDPRLLSPLVFRPDDLKDLKIAERGNDIDFSKRTGSHLARLCLQKESSQIEQATTLPPKIIIQEATKLLELGDSGEFLPVKFEYSYFYLPDGGSRLDQSIGLSDLRRSVSPAIEALYLRRLVDAYEGDLTYAEIVFRPSQGFSGASSHDIAIITNKGIFTLDDGSGLRPLTEKERQFIEQQGIEYNLKDNLPKPSFEFGFDNFRGELQLEKNPHPDYVRRMFEPTPRWVTQSKVAVCYGDYSGVIE